ncbi:U-box domain-containing protein [Pleurostoma richardsiae]|uniref:U-box domain-containing protein n=1 Tax=Pleurostoma richardsiae TaxID=41990 RepID=A0AA38RTH1_9PEZI|nr:U-box domain-containing protein [Pleurostoma richardsiae]
MSSKALLLKEEGNRHFQAGDYTGAEGLYSKAIIADPRNPTLYTNRAMARLRLNLWDSAISDCQACLELSADNMKAYYYLSQAHLALKDYDDALSSARRAYELCAAANDKSLAAITAQVLRCKKERWDDAERRRAREGAELEAELAVMMERERDEAAAACEDDSDKAEVEAEWARRIAQMREVFERARAQEDRKREVPDWAIDDISFSVMVDPVITKTGKSYERASIMEHLRRHPTDPLTREPLYPSDLRPNLGLKQACEEFLDSNGWAVDW